MFTEAYPPQHIARSEKSTVSRTFRDLGCLIIDVDPLTREVVEPGEPMRRSLSSVRKGVILDLGIWSDIVDA